VETKKPGRPRETSESEKEEIRKEINRKYYESSKDAEKEKAKPGRSRQISASEKEEARKGEIHD
jgi:hypothetical protein